MRQLEGLRGDRAGLLCALDEHILQSLLLDQELRVALADRGKQLDHGLADVPLESHVAGGVAVLLLEDIRSKPNEAMRRLRQQEHEDHNDCNDQPTDGDLQCKEFPSMLGLPQSGISDEGGDEASADRDAEKTS